jgi:outer membrane protein assembly factor BamB
MTTTSPAPEPKPRPPLRLRSAVVIAVLLVLVRYVMPAVAAETMFFGVLGGLVGFLAVVVWWVFFSRAPWSERLGFPLLMFAALAGTTLILDKSIATGAMGMLFYVLAVPVVALAFVAAVVAGRHLSPGPRRAAMAAAILAACGVFALVRTGGFTGGGDNDFAWRWSETPEERLLAQAGDEAVAIPSPPPSPLPTAPPATSAPAERPKAAASEEAKVVAPPPPPAVATAPEWPGFRGPERNARVHGARIATDWSTSPPIELWRRPIGPGWSSFAVRGDLLYTQEQRGEDELVACYDVQTGKPVWRHRTAARFWESNAGAGPRGTPTLHDGRVYAFGATGIVNALDARTGALVWSHDAAADTGTEIPAWGYSSSPLVVGDLVIVAASGRLVAYDAGSGDRRWLGPADGGGSYSSPQLATIDGIAQVLLLNAAGLTSVTPSDGTRLWQHAWKGYPIVQPALTPDGGILVAVTESSGTRRLAVAQGPGGWTVTARWTSQGLKPYFNDFVVHGGHAYGFDGRILACIDLEDGQRKWKGGRYGSGQLVLLPDQDVLLVMSEQGELALVKATPDQFTELARWPALDGKTWNHPVLAGDVLLTRNDQEMAAFRLSLAGITAKVSAGRRTSSRD